MKKTLKLMTLFVLLASLGQCGRSKDDSADATDSRIPGGWDGKSDFSGSAFTIKSAS